jgi:hypothetical protein
MNTRLNATVFGALLVLGASSVNAALIPITNASFEDGVGTTTITNPLGNYSEGSFPGWTVTGSAGRYDPNGTLSPEAVDGTFTAWSNGGTLLQTLGANLTANTTYTLSLFVGDRSDTAFPGFTVDLLAGGSALTGGSTIFSAPANGGWSSYSYTFTSLVNGGALGIQLGSNGVQTNFDNVSLTAVAAIPEPETYAMFLAGLGLLGFAARKRNV